MTYNISKNILKTKSIKIKKTDFRIVRESYLRPFGFKGQFDLEAWHTIVYLESESGIQKVGMHNQSVLWSDPSVFQNFTKEDGNKLMVSVTEKALELIKEVSFNVPFELLDNLFQQVYPYGKKMTNNPDLRKTFILNALVGIDLAVWLIYAEENGMKTFFDIIPENFKSAFPYKHKKIACIPLISYGVPIKEVINIAKQGYSILKIKIGQSGTEQEMLEKDKRRILDIHQAVGHLERENFQNGKIAYYVDANGRYKQKETVLKLLEFMHKIGAYDQILILEEPFSEINENTVDDLGVWVAADESLQSVEDASIRMQLGYSAFALKPIAKTLSETFKIGELAHHFKIPCFCADLTVPPILVEWNKVVAARLMPFPGWEMGFLESNGFQNYKNWKHLQSYLPFPKASWVNPQNGFYFLGEDYYQKDGGIFESSKKLLNLFD